MTPSEKLFADQAVEEWFSLLSDQSNLKDRIDKINRFLKRASFEVEDYYYQQIYRLRTDQ